MISTVGWVIITAVLVGLIVVLRTLRHRRIDRIRRQVDSGERQPMAEDEKARVRWMALGGVTLIAIAWLVAWYLHLPH